MTNNPIFSKIQEQVSQNNVVLYMKGTAQAPQCGFSHQVANILKTLNIPFLDVDVLNSPEFRQGIKDFTNWPTIPQLYIKGEFIGGYDIVQQMYQTGELQDLLKKEQILLNPEYNTSH